MTSEIRARTLDWGTGWASVPDGGALQRELDRELAARRQVVSQNNAKPSRAAYDGQGRPGATVRTGRKPEARRGAHSLWITPLQAPRRFRGTPSLRRPTLSLIVRRLDQAPRT